MEYLSAHQLRAMQARLPSSIRSLEALLGLTAIFVAVLILSIQAVFAHDLASMPTVGTIHIESPWARATPPGAAVGGGYLVIHNSGPDADRLVSAETDVAGMVEIHKMAVENGVMTMAPVDGGLEIPAGQAVKLEPGSFHLMLMDLKRPLKEGDTFKATLTFAKAGSITVDFAIRAIGADAPMDMDDD
jgi:copper(I)-binding protein